MTKSPQTVSVRPSFQDEWVRKALWVEEAVNVDVQLDSIYESNFDSISRKLNP